MRKILFWAHLIAGATAAIVIFIMSVTGVLLMYEHQMIAWADRGFKSAPSDTKLSPEALLKRVAEQEGANPSSLTLYSTAGAAAEIGIGPRIVYADTGSGQVLGTGSQGIRRFFRAVTDWHRWLALQGEQRQLGRSITGAANLIFLLLALSGMYLWLPRKWTGSNVRAVAFFRGGLTGKARDFNWHNVIGIWSAVPLVFVILGALVISYPWATQLVYRVAGDVPPQAPSGPGRGGPGSGGRLNLTGLDQAWKQAESAVPGWYTITWRAAGGNRISLAVAESHRGRVDLKSTVLVDSATGNLIGHEKYESYSRGRQWRLWLRFIHTGEALGLAGQTIAGVVSAGGAVLVWTGLALTWRRFRAWRQRSRRVPASDREMASTR